MSWYIKVIKNYVGFSGRARRKEYWMFVLFNAIFMIVALLLDNLFKSTFSGNGGYGYIYMLYTLAIFLPGLAVAVRRLHDLGKSGWWYFIILIPLAGPIWFLVLMCTDSQPGPNQYGPNPKELAPPVPPVQTFPVP